MQIRVCKKEDLEQILKLQEKICAGMEIPEWFAATPAEENAWFLEEPNRIFGIFDEGHLIAYGSVGFQGSNKDNLGWDLGWTEEKVRQCAVLDTIVVDSAYRGKGLQRTLIRCCMEYAREVAGCERMLTTVAPGNIYSLKNVQAEGFEIIAEKKKYGGKERYILVRNVRDYMDFNSNKIE